MRARTGAIRRGESKTAQADKALRRYIDVYFEKSSVVNQIIIIPVMVVRVSNPVISKMDYYG